MDELDQLLQDLSAPKAHTVERSSVMPPAAPVQTLSVTVAEPPKPQKVDFNELDSLMAELGASAATPVATKPAVEPPVTSSPAPVRASVAPAAVIVAAAAAPAPAPAHAATSSVDDLLAELSASAAAPPSARPSMSSAVKPPAAAVAVLPTASQPSDDLDSVLNSLQGLSTTPASVAPSTTASVAFAPAVPSSRKNELDNILNSLSSEMNEIGAAGDFKGQCAMCKKPIVGQAITALGKTWHTEHFACLQCRKPLTSQSFFEKDGMPYCEKCYQDMFSPKCAYCDGPIRERCINALGKTWHPDHFFCSQCGKNFSGGGFMEKDGKAYCEEDYFNMFAPKCGGCEKPIMADCLTALGRQWHPACFVCMECRQPFTGTFFEHENKPYCEKHYHSQKGTLCASCQKPVIGRAVTALGKRFHPEHFVCAFCMKQLAKGTFKENSGKAYCMPCHIKLWG